MGAPKVGSWTVIMTMSEEDVPESGYDHDSDGDWSSVVHVERSERLDGWE